MEDDASRSASRRQTPKLSMTSHAASQGSARAGRRGSRISTLTGRAETDATPRSSRDGARSIDDRLLGVDDDPFRASESRRAPTESLVAAMSKPVSDSVSEAVSELVRAQLIDLAARLVEAVCDIQVEVAKACMKDMYTELAARLTKDLAPALADASLRAPPPHSLTIPSMSMGPARTMMSASQSVVSRASTSMYRRVGSGNTLTSMVDEGSARDVRSLENTLADQLLEDLGLSSAPPSRPRGQKKRKTSGCRSESGSSGSMMPVVPVTSVASDPHGPSFHGADAERGEDRRSKSLSMPAAAVVAASAVGAATAKMESSRRREAAKADVARDEEHPQVPRKEARAPEEAMTPPPPATVHCPDLAPPDSGEPVMLDLPNAINSLDEEDRGRSSSELLGTSQGETLHTEEDAEEKEEEEPEARSRSVGSAQQRSARPGRRMTTGEVLRVRVEELVDEIPILDPSNCDISVEHPEAAWSTVSLLLGAFKICGLTPWSYRCPCACRAYRVCCLFCAALAACSLLAESASQRGELLRLDRRCGSASVCWRQRGLLSEMPLAASLIVGFVVLGVWRRSTRLVNTLLLLESYAFQHGLTEKLLSRARRETRWFGALSASAVALGVGGMLLEAQQEPMPVEAVLFGAAQLATFLMLLCMCSSLAYICSGLGMCADAFCCNVVDDLDLGTVVHEWNVLQAILRKSSGTIELALVAFMCAIMFYLPSLMLDFLAIPEYRDTPPALAPGLVVSLGIIRFLFLAAAITDKCTRIPPLMNSLSFGPGTERYRQYIVDYITNSAAGFYVFDVRLSTAMVLKLIYIWGVVAFGLSTQLLSQK